MKNALFVCLLLLSFNIDAEPRFRPETWATPIINTSLDNFYRVDKGIYRSAQPDEYDIDDLQTLGITQVLNLRKFHDDEDELGDKNFTLYDVPMIATSVSEKQILEALHVINNRKQPILIHCWHGSDRTGVTIAAYRMVFNNWTKKQALDEMKHGGYGYHAFAFPNLVALIEKLDTTKIRNELGLE